jgi:hypothetical protein
MGSFFGLLAVALALALVCVIGAHLLNQERT